MRRILERLEALIDDRQFKHTPQGWLFRAPTPLFLGPRPHYLVNEAQKGKIKIVLAASNLIVSVTLIAVVSLLFLMRHSVVPNIPLLSNNFMLVFLLCGLFVIGLQNLFHCLALRRLLKNSPRTTERITLAERLRTTATMYSVWHLKFDLMLFSALFLVSLVMSAYQLFVLNAWDVYWYLGVAVLASATIYFAAILRAKLGASERN